MIRNEIIKKITSYAPSQPYTTDELAMLYGITAKTFLKWLKPFQDEIGEKIGWYFNIRQVNIIFEKLGRPEKNECQ
jgi:hypothetical protein